MHDREDIAKLIPHAGAMCLLERIVRSDPDRIVCSTMSHRSPENPLRRDGRLCAVHAVEYGAQAVAVHRSLRAPTGRKVPGRAYLASLKDTRIHVLQLDDLDTELVVDARCLLATAGGAIYRFAVHAGDLLVCDGRASVVEARAET